SLPHKSVSLPLNEKFDLIYITPCLTSHLPGRNFRVSFLASLIQFSHPETVLWGMADVLDLTHKNYFFWASQILRMRAFFARGQWEKGDTFRTHLGSGGRRRDPLFHHFYPTLQDFMGEIEGAGWTTGPMANDFIWAKISQSKNKDTHGSTHHRSA